MDDSELYRSLCEILGARGVRDSAALAGQDPGYHPQNLAGSFLVLPESTDQVAAVVRLCRQAGRALVPQGGLTGLVGGGAAQAGDVLLSLRRLNRIHRLDAASQTLDLDAGVTLEQAQALAAEAGLDPGIDLAARGSASIGGLVATNAGGIRAFRFGTVRQRVLGLEAVLADGSVYSDLRGLLKNTTGYDLKQLFVGAEGTLGIVTRAVLRLEPLQRPGATALLGLPDVDAAITIAARLRREHAERLFACEILWHDYLQCTAAPMGDSAPSLAPCPLYLLVGWPRTATWMPARRSPPCWKTASRTGWWKTPCSPPTKPSAWPSGACAKTPTRPSTPASTACPSTYRCRCRPWPATSSASGGAWTTW